MMLCVNIKATTVLLDWAELINLRQIIDDNGVNFDARVQCSENVMNNVMCGIEMKIVLHRRLLLKKIPWWYI